METSARACSGKLVAGVINIAWDGTIYVDTIDVVISRVIGRRLEGYLACIANVTKVVP